MSETCPRHAPQVLPYEADARSRFVLKLHGDLRRPQDIVLTRAQLSGAREQRAALSGVVQGLLMTKHLCFVGFSLQDPNFSEVARDRDYARLRESTETVRAIPSLNRPAGCRDRPRHSHGRLEHRVAQPLWLAPLAPQPAPPRAAAVTAND